MKVENTTQKRYAVEDRIVKAFRKRRQHKLLSFLAYCKGSPKTVFFKRFMGYSH